MPLADPARRAKSGRMTLTLSLIVLGVTALFGLILFALYQFGRSTGRIWWPGAAHGALGLTGLLLLLAGMGGPPRGVASGAAGFGVIAAWMIGLGFALGALLFVCRLRRRPPASVVIGVHATLAVGGIVMLAAYLS